MAGGTSGHLGLVLSPLEMASVTTVPYVRYLQLAPLVIPSGITLDAATRLREDHKEAKRLFKEMIDLEKLLKSQLRRAIPEMYLTPYINQNSNKIFTDIQPSLQDLFSTYGKVSPTELQIIKNELKNWVHDITQPFIALFNEVNDLQEMAQAAEDPKMEQQLIELGKTVLKNTKEFE